MEIKDKIKFFLKEGSATPLRDRIAAVQAKKAGQVTTPNTPNTTNNNAVAQRVLLKNKPALKKMLLHMQWNDNRLHSNDIKSHLGNDLYNQVMSLGWLQKTNKPGDFYELSNGGVQAIGRL